MPDRVKQSIFDMLASRYDTPGALPPLLVADVFAGGGSMGLEALSRGAAFCSFFERDRQALEALRGNIAALGAEQVSRIIAGDAWRASMTTPTELVREGILTPAALIFLDPPYRDCEDTTGRGEVRRFLRRIGDAPVLERLDCNQEPLSPAGGSDEPTEGRTSRPRVRRADRVGRVREGPGGSESRVRGSQDALLVVLHHPAGTQFVLAEDDPWQVVEERRIGSNAVTFFAR